jgi:hypothetical protein
LRCVLHIGTEKTATTLIQEWLYANCDQLSSQAVALTKASGYPNNRKLVSYFQYGIDEYLRSNDVHNEKERLLFFENFEKDFSDEISDLKNDHTTFVFTSEHFHSRLTSTSQIQRLKEFLDQFFNDYEILCYFREQSRVRTSLYSTGLKIRNSSSILEFQKDVNIESEYYNYLSFFMKWEEVFGKKALTARLFCKDRMPDGDIRKDLLASTLPDINAEKLDYKVNSINESLSADEAILFLAINAARNNFVGKYPDPTPYVIKNAVKNSDLLDRKTSICDPRQNAIYDEFNDVNVQFFLRYFDEEKNLFPRPKKTCENADSHRQFDISDFAKFLNSILSIKNLIVIDDREVDFLRDLAITLHSSGAVSNTEAITLLKLANRARPAGGVISSKIDELRNEK